MKAVRRRCCCSPRPRAGQLQAGSDALAGSLARRAPPRGARALPRGARLELRAWASGEGTCNRRDFRRAIKGSASSRGRRLLARDRLLWSQRWATGGGAGATRRCCRRYNKVARTGAAPSVAAGRAAGPRGPRDARSRRRPELRRTRTACRRPSNRADGRQAARW